MVEFIAANWLWIALLAAMLIVLHGGQRSHGGRTQDTTPPGERGGNRHGSNR